MFEVQTQRRDSPVGRVIEVIGRGANLIENLSDEIYARRDPANRGSVGGRFAASPNSSSGSPKASRRDKSMTAAASATRETRESNRTAAMPFRDSSRRSSGCRIYRRTSSTSEFCRASNRSAAAFETNNVVFPASFTGSNARRAARFDDHALIAEKLSARGVTAEKISAPLRPRRNFGTAKGGPVKITRAGK